MHPHFTVLLRSLITVVWFATFVGLCLWAWSGRRRKDFDAAARLPFDDAGAATGPREGDR